MDYSIGSSVLDKWVITRLIGEGAYGRVYEIEKSKYGVTTKSALKVIRVPHSQGDWDAVMSEGMDEATATSYFRGFVDEIVQEIAIMSSLKSHPHIVSCEDYEVIPHEDGKGWDILIRMELLISLLNYQKSHAMDVETVRRMGMELADALEYCEGKGLIHRDIKPENIFVSETGAFKLGDFGVARTVEKTTGGMSKKGTESYMAPEVYKGQPYNATVDIYSLGLVLYRYLNGNRLPFFPAAPQPITYMDRENALAKRMQGAAMPLPAGADEALGLTVIKACAYNPGDRYQSGAEMRAALQSGITVPKGEARKEDAYDEADDLGVGLGAEDSLTIGIWGNRPKETTGSISNRRTDDFHDHAPSQQEFKEEEEHTIGIWGKQPEIISRPKPGTNARSSGSSPSSDYRIVKVDSTPRPNSASATSKPKTLSQDEMSVLEPEKKKSKAGKVIGIMMLILAVLAGIGLYIQYGGGSSSTYPSVSNKTSQTTSTTTSKPPLPSGKTSKAESSKAASQANSTSSSSSQESKTSFGIPSKELITPGRLMVACFDYYFDGSSGEIIIQEIADRLGLKLVWITIDPTTINAWEDFLKIQADLICVSIVDDSNFVEEYNFLTYLKDNADDLGDNVLNHFTESYYHRIQSAENGYYYHNCFIVPKSEVLNYMVSDISLELYYSGEADEMWDFGR